jgi:hypothetical protein
MSKVSAYNLLKYLIVETNTIMYSTNLPRYRPITFTSSSSSRQARQRLSCLFARIFNQKAWRRLRVCSAVCSSLCPPPPSSTKNNLQSWTFSFEIPTEVVSYFSNFRRHGSRRTAPS